MDEPGYGKMKKMQTALTIVIAATVLFGGLFLRQIGFRVNMQSGKRILRIISHIYWFGKYTIQERDGCRPEMKMAAINRRTMSMWI